MNFKAVGPILRNGYVLYMRERVLRIFGGTTSTVKMMTVVMMGRMDRIVEE